MVAPDLSVEPAFLVVFSSESEYRRIIEAGGEVRKWGVERVYEPGRQSPVRPARVFRQDSCV